MEEAETAIARAAGVAPSGATALPAAATAAANGLPLSRDPSAAQVGPGPAFSNHSLCIM